VLRLKVHVKGIPRNNRMTAINRSLTYVFGTTDGNAIVDFTYDLYVSILFFHCPLKREHFLQKKLILYTKRDD